MPTKEIRTALRSLVRTPIFTIVAVVTLGLGIGMWVTVWSVIDSVLINPLPYPDADRLVEIRSTEPERSQIGYPMPALDFLDLEERQTSFDSMAAVFRENLNLTGDSSPERVSGAWVTARFFDVMGIPPESGRSFTVDDDTPGHDRVAVISDGLRHHRFSASTTVIGETVIVNGLPHVIVGVAPAGFAFPNDTEIWLPMAIDPGTEDRNHGRVIAYGRIRPGVSITNARVDLEHIAEQLRQEHPDTNSGESVGVQALRDQIVGDVSSSLLVLLGAVGCVLLIATANVAILLSVRTAARQRELAVRQALGASRSQLVRLVMVEGVLLALGGGAVGVVFAHWGTRLMSSRFADLIPRTETLGIDAGVLAVAVLLSVAVGLLVGLQPAMRSKDTEIMARLRSADRSVVGGSSRIGTAMVVAEIALSVVLLVGAVLLTRTFINLLSVDPGFESDRVLTAEVALTGERYAGVEDRIEFYRRVLDEIGSTPNVEAVGTVYPLPLFARRISTRSYVEGAPVPESEAQRPIVDLRFVSPGYLDAVGLHLEAGRFIEDYDTSSSPDVVVVNESFVRQLVPQGEPVGRRTTGWDPDDPEAEWQTIVGVVKNVRHIDLADDAGPEMYIPVAQEGFEWATIVVRAKTGSATALANPIRDVIARIDPELPIFNIQTMDEVVVDSLERKNFITALLVLFASVGLALTGVGVFSVVSYSVGQRIHEVAVRMAVGGSPGRVVALIVRQGLSPVVAGLVLGVTTAVVVMRVLASRLFGIAANDPLTLSGTVLLVLGIAALAAWLPARRATRVDPSAVLRAE